MEVLGGLEGWCLVQGIYTPRGQRPRRIVSTLGVTLKSHKAPGAFADTLTHPICTIKARLMTQGSAAGAAADAGGVTQYRGLLHGFRMVATKEGIAGLYAGLGVVLIGAAPAQALYFGGMTAVLALLGCLVFTGSNGEGLSWSSLPEVFFLLPVLLPMLLISNGERREQPETWSYHGLSVSVP